MTFLFFLYCQCRTSGGSVYRNTEPISDIGRLVLLIWPLCAEYNITGWEYHFKSSVESVSIACRCRSTLHVITNMDIRVFLIFISIRLPLLMKWLQLTAWLFNEFKCCCKYCPVLYSGEGSYQGHREFPFWKRKIHPAKEKIPENSRSVNAWSCTL